MGFVRMRWCLTCCHLACYGYKVVTFEINDIKCDNNSNFILEVTVYAKAEVEIKQFWSSFNQRSSCTFNLNGHQDRRQVDGNW